MIFVLELQHSTTEKLNLLKPSREKRIPKVMQDASMTFYDPNASLKKSFGKRSPEYELVEFFRSSTSELE